jgi:hypothetical protein
MQFEYRKIKGIICIVKKFAYNLEIDKKRENRGFCVEEGGRK